MECFKFDVINTVNRVGLQCDYPLEERQKYIYELLGKDTLIEFKESFVEILSIFQLKKQEQKSSQGICRRTRKSVFSGGGDGDVRLSSV